MNQKAGTLGQWARAGTNPEDDEESGGGGGSSSSVASWLTAVRYFFLDYDAGNDANAGFIDAAAGATFTTAQAAAVAIKTVEQLYAIVPQVGNGHSFVILQKNRAAGASYFDKDGVTVSSVDTSRWVGYRSYLWRGSTDLTNNTADRITCGFIVAVAGPGAGSSFVVAAGATTTLVPIAAGAIAAEAATQFRVRFQPTTATVALRNVCRNVVSNVLNASVTLGDALPAVPAAGDVFVIEQPGVRMDQMNFDQRASGVFVPGGLSAPALVGLAFTTSVAAGAGIMGARMSVSGIELTATTGNAVWFPNQVQFLTVSDSYTNELGANVRCGLGLRSGAGSSWAVGSVCNAAALGFMNRAANNTLNMARGGGFGARSYLGGQWTVQGSNSGEVGDPPGTNASEACFGDSTTTNAQPRLTGHTTSTTPLTIFAFPVNCWRLKFENFGLAIHGCLYIKDIFGGQMNVDGCTGDGTGPYGLDCSQSTRLQLSVGTQIANTVTGTVGDVRLFGNAVARWADFTKTNIVDGQGNNVQGTGGSLVGQCRLTTCKAADGLSVGSLCHFTATGVNASARNDDFTAAKCNAVAVMTAGQNALMYVATPSSAGTPYVLSETVVVGGMAYVGLYAGGNAKANSNPANAGQFETAVGVWIDGADNSSGHLAWNPDQWPTFVDVLAVTSGANGDGLPFIIPANMAAVQYVSMETGKAAGDEVSLGFTNTRIDIFLKATANPNEFVTRWFDAGSGHNTTVRVKWAFR